MRNRQRKKDQAVFDPVNENLIFILNLIFEEYRSFLWSTIGYFIMLHFQSIFLIFFLVIFTE